MTFVLKKSKQLLLTAMLTFFAVIAMSQKVRPHASGNATSKQLRIFNRLAARANTVFVYPPDFKEISTAKDSRFPFDYAMELPGHDFEIWLKVCSQKRMLQEYRQKNADTTGMVENVDSLYNNAGLALAGVLAGDQNYFTTNIPQDVLDRYNATAGKTYLLELIDRAETKHYKYALLITLHKDHAGTILAVCFSNEKGADFFKNINMAGKCLKFKS
jgi:hypothetical protein